MHLFNFLLAKGQLKHFTTMNTHRGLFCDNRLLFGISSSPAIFQRSIGNLQGIQMTCGYQDDILIFGEDDVHHVQNVESVFKRLSGT